MGHACLNLGSSNKLYLDSANNHFIAMLGRLTRNDYYYVMALDGLGRTRMEKNKLTEAQETFEMALESAKNDQKPFLYYMAQAIAMKKGNKQEADNWRQKLVSEFPHSLEGRKFTKPNPSQFSRSVNVKLSEENQCAIQLGAFSTRTKAESAMQNLKKKGIETQVIPKTIQTGNIFVLQTKTFNSRESAKTYANTLLTPYGISFFIVEKN
jgi:tetratricopeptide (TPR) repeat protein